MPTSSETITLDTAAEAIGAIDASHRDTWLQVGMALKMEFGDEAYSIWDQWSQSADSYNQADAHSVWKSFKPTGKVTIGTFIYLAKQAGYSFPREELSEEEKQRRRDEALARQKRLEKERAEQARQEAENARIAAWRARKMWQEKLVDHGEARYLARKKVQGHGLKYSPKGSAVAVLQDAGGGIHGLQFLMPDGQKRFWPKHMRVTGHYHLIGQPAASGRVLIGVCEGYATGASLFEATGIPLYVAFNAGNLKPVAEVARQLYPDAEIVVFGDDDHQTEGNPGKKKAQEAALAVQGRYLLPRFSVRDDENWTDFNDLAVHEGWEAVKEQVMTALEQKDKGEGQALGANAPHPLTGRWGKEDSNVEWMLENYVLIYGTTTVFDKHAGKIMTLEALRAAIGKSVVKDWQEHPSRLTVDEKNIVFDPTRNDSAPYTINLFRGFGIEPERGQCEKLLECLFYLCNESHNVVDWVLKWLAYPLQHPGSKMRTSIIMHGPEGTGKNKFFGAVRDIYGEHGGIITQNQLESSFNGWASGKLFLIGNEVISRSEMFHQKGMIKNMITEPEWMVDEKFLPVRTEVNLCNFVFFSNFMQPASPDPDDRRFLVIWTPEPKEDDFYIAVDQEVKQGGVGALYDYLLNYDLGEFSEYTKPIMTEAKEELIELSMLSHQRFLSQWQRGALPVQFSPCLVKDLYSAYRHWCNEEGEKMFVHAYEFAMVAGRRCPVNKKRDAHYSWNKQTKKGTFLIPEALSKPDAVSTQEWLGRCRRSFLDELETWKGTEVPMVM